MECERGMKKTKIHPHIETGLILQTRGLGKSTAARKYLASTVARLSDPYVPMSAGAGVHMKNQVQIDAEGRAILYRQSYAHYQYYGEVMVGRAPKHYTGKPINYHGGPLRGKEWDKRMMADKGREVMDDLAKFVGGKRI